jgi:ATP-dependent RNA helicase DeaD
LNVVYVLPQSLDSVPKFLTAPLERVDATQGGTQLVVVTEDPESAVALAEAVLRITGLGGIELFPVTSPRRAARLMQGRPVLAIGGSPTDLAELIRGSSLKLQDVRSLVLAWGDDILHGDAESATALELIMTEVPKDAARVVVTAHPDQRVDAFVERYLRRARRVDERQIPPASEPVSLQYVTTTNVVRSRALRRLLDDLDPPSATIVVDSTESEQEVAALLRALGYPAEGDVRVSRTEIPPNTHAVIFYGLPATRALLDAAAAATPVLIVALIQPRDVPQLRRLAGGNVRPLTLTGSGRTARDRERELRGELNEVLENGVSARELHALEPLVERYDPIEIAAATVRLLERERALRKSVEVSAAAILTKREPVQLADRRPGRGSSDRDRRDRPPRSGKPRDFRRDRDSRDRDSRDRDRRPPRDHR